MKQLLSLFLMLCCLTLQAKDKVKADVWPDGTKIDAWFSDTTKVDVNTLGKKYVITDYGVSQDPDIIQTQAIQAVIDRCSKEGGGVIVFPTGTYVSGALFFKPGTHLHLCDGATLKGTDRVENYPLMETRIEGETCLYFPALVNADHVDNFTITGKGTIDGSGYHFWKEFWIRCKWAEGHATNKDGQRPRLVYISNSSNVTVQDVHTINSAFWTNHIYNCDHVRYLNCYIYAPTEGLRAPSSDALDIDKCHDVIVNSCYMNVNDDAVVLKGGKGTYADTMSVNGPVDRVMIQNCHYGRVHGMLVLGSESLHDSNIILRNCVADNVDRVLWLKMRPDTPQQYENILVDGISGKTRSGLVIRPWTQYYNMKDRKDMPRSYCRNVTLKNIKMDCQNFFDVGTSEKYDLLNFTFENVDVTDVKNAFDKNVIENTTVKKVNINGKRM